MEKATWPYRGNSKGSRADTAWCKGLKTFGWRTWEEVKRWPESIRWASACAKGTRGPMWDGAGRTVPSNPVRSSKQDTWRQKRHRWRWGAHLGDPITAECVNRLCAVIHSCSGKTVKMKSQPDQKSCTCKPHPLPTSGMEEDEFSRSRIIKPAPLRFGIWTVCSSTVTDVFNFTLDLFQAYRRWRRT